MSDCPEETSSVVSDDDCVHNITLENSVQYAADNSIIGKVKSRVSSILPNRISKWFATASTTSNNSSLNGSFMSTSILAKRRRHLDDDDNDNDDDDDIDTEDNEENNDDINEGPINQIDDYRFQRSNSSRSRSNIENDLTEPNIHDDDDNYGKVEGDLSRENNNNLTQRKTTPSRDGNLIMDRHALRQPPAKRSRFENLTESDNNSNPLVMSQQQFVASTPATHTINNTRQQFHTDSIVQRSSYNSHSRYKTNIKLNKNEPAYDFTKAATTTSAVKTYTNLDSAYNVLNNPQEAHRTSFNIHLEQSVDAYNQPSTSSRKILNIPPLCSLSSNAKRSERFINSTLHLKRLPLSSVKMKTDTGALTSINHSVTHAIHDIINDSEDDYVDGNDMNDSVVNDGKEVQRTELTTNSNRCHKKLKLVNGSTVRKNETLMLADTASESDDSNDNNSMNNRNIIDDDDHEQQFNQRKTGLYNLTSRTKSASITQMVANVNDSSNKRRFEHDLEHDRGQRLGYDSRTSSYGNDLNFYSHLEGNKSLFGNRTNSTIRGTAIENSTLNNSTLSLTSLNRRQFNASIYSSTSALSDSRLLNTFSPFYKGRTTYGGAAAYNKTYNGVGTGIAGSMGASSAAVRLAPTIIRPTSSLSNLSTSSNSLLNVTGHHLYHRSMGDNNSTISSTAKRILELITDINTPLSDAKKMAHSLRPIPPHARNRLNDDDVNATRLASTHAVRLSRVSKPYSRPNNVVLLQSKRSGYGNLGGGMGSSSILPPIKELQVPSMSQLLQMKRMQNITEKARHITTQNIQGNLTAGVASAITRKTGLRVEHDLSQLHDSNRKDTPQQTAYSVQEQQEWQDQQEQDQQQQQQEYTNKIRNKFHIYESPPPPPNLPNIPFPLMQSNPTFDIELPTVIGPSKSSSSSTTSFSSISSTITLTTPATSELSLVSKTSTDFKFSSPLTIDDDDTLITSQNDDDIDAVTCANNYEFSMPTYAPATILNDTDKQLSTMSTPAPLKNGSVLEVLYNKSAFNISGIDMPATATTPQNNDQMAKMTNEWECDTCWIRNKIDVINCAACGMQRTNIAATTTATPSMITIITTASEKSSLPASTDSTISFGNQFKKANDEWDCDVCMIRNKMDATKCVACEAQRKNVTLSSQLLTFSASSSPLSATLLKSVNNTFGDAFKTKPNTWECKTCLIMNNVEVNECVACQSKRPGSTLKVDLINGKANAGPLTSFPFKFGFANATNPINAPSTTVDAGFKALASQQKQLKWECEACMTRNDAARKKCVCCEQPRTGLMESLNNGTSTSKFVFGGTATPTKYTFGFGSILGTQKEEDLKTDSSSHLPNTLPNTNSLAGSQMVVNDIGETFQNQSQFQLQPAKDKDIADGVSKSQPNGSSQTTETTTATTITTMSSELMANIQKPIESSEEASTTATTTPADCPATNIKFNLVSSFNTKNMFATTTETSATDATITTAVTTASSTTTTITSDGGNRLNCINQEKFASNESIFKTSTLTFLNASKPLSSGTGFTFGSITPNKEQVVNNSIANATATTSAAITTSETVNSAFAMPTTATDIGSKNNLPLGGFTFGANTLNSPKSYGIENASTQAVATTNATNTFSTKPATITVDSSSNAATVTTNSPTAVPSNAIQSNIFGGIVSSSTMTSPATNTSSNVFAMPNNSNNNNNNNNNNNSDNNGKSQSSNLFSSFSGNRSGTTATTTTTTATQPLFGSSNSTSMGGFTFGLAAAKSPLKTTETVNTAAATAALVTTTAAPSSSSGMTLTSSQTSSSSSAATTTISAWPKNNFTFGTNTNEINPTEQKQPKQNPLQGASMFTFAASTVNSNANAANKAIFGAEVATTTTTTTTTSTTINNDSQSGAIFGNVASSSTLPKPQNSIFGSNATAPQPSSASIFGASLTNSSPAHIFGNTTFGGTSSSAPSPSSAIAATSAISMPTFGSASTSATTSTFGGFGVLAANETKSATLEATQPSNALPFTFGANSNTSATTQKVGFNFSSAATKTSVAPVFNFGSATGSGTTSQPTFNFTGISEQSQNVVKPFQFGATPSTPFYKFTGGATEVAPNAPFQFNAAPTPTSTNIFAPNSTPGAASTQQARRKIRPPVRRLTPR